MRKLEALRKHILQNEHQRKVYISKKTPLYYATSSHTMIGCFGIGRVEHDRPPYHQIRGVHQYENSLMEVESLRRHGLKVDSLVYYIKACFKWPNILLSGCDSYHHTLILSDLVYIWQQLLLFNRLSWSYHLHQLAECAYHIVNEKLRYWV